MGIGVQQGIPGSGRRRQWLPTALSNLVAWFRSDLGITQISGVVSAWGNQSGTGQHLTQGTPGNRLAYNDTDATFNGRPTLEGTGAAWLDGTASWGLVQPITVYAAARTADTADYQTAVLDAASGGRIIGRVTAGETLSMFAGTGNIEPGGSLASPSIVCCVFNGASSAGYVNSTTASITGNPGANGLGTPRVGAAPAGSYPLAAGSKVAELLVYNAAHSAAERAQVLRYLSSRYAISVAGL